MGKRRIAGSVRRCVASGLSRVTRTLFHNNEERQTPFKDPVSNGAPAVASKLNHVPPELLPATKVPALDTVDAYAVDRPIEDHASGASQRIKLACRLCSSDIPSLIDGLIRGYARFVSSLTGLEDIAFCSTRRWPFVASKPFTSVVVASGIQPGGQSNFDIREVDAAYHDEDEIQFFAELGSVSPENGRPEFPSHENGFTLHAELDSKKSVLYISFTYPKQLIPAAAVENLLRTLSLNIAQSCPSLNPSAPEPTPSILNFPSAMIPPATNFVGVEISPSDSYILHAAFEGWARRNPHAIALDFVHSLETETSPAEHSTLSYAALDTAASFLALHITSLLSSGRPATYGRIIPVNMPTSPELYISYLAILKAGHAFCPIPQDVPEQSKEEIIRDIGSPIILANTPEPIEWGTIRGSTLELTPTWVDVSEVSRWKELQGEWNPSFPTAPESSHVPSLQKEQTAYLLFTSGSTGKPKGVQVSHLAASCSIASHATAIPLPGEVAGDFRWFQFASPSFDPSLMEIFVTISSGGTLCSADRRLTLSNLEATINEARATIMMATPSLASLLRPSHLETLEALWSMGEKLTRTVIDNFVPNPQTNGDSGPLLLKPKTLVNAYGPTEGAINCTYVAPFERYMRGSIIGKPLPTCSMFVLSPDSQEEPMPVPVGTVGELAIGGPQVSKGYLNRPEETAKSFIQTEKFGYIYRTGDKARIVWAADGSEVIEYLGRISTDQVKINGRRIELGEIESVIATVPGVQEVVVVVAKKNGKPGGSEQIVACLVVDQGTTTDQKRIIQQAKENAARHLIPSNCPSAYRFLDALPRSSSGKVDRKALSAAIQKDEVEVPVVNGQSVEKEDVWLTSDDENLLPLQHLVIQLVAETAGEDVSSIKPETELYSMGLDSLGAMRFLQRLKDHGVDGVAVSDVLQSQTCQALVTLVQQHQTKHNDLPNSVQNGDSKDSFISYLQAFDQRNRIRCAKQLEISPDTIGDVLPTTATQSGMLASFLRSLSDKSYAKPTYIYHTALELQTHVDIANLEKAWNDVVASYDSLRTVFCMVDDEMAPFAQCVLKPETAPKQEWDVYTSPNEVAAANSFNQGLRNAEKSISLERPPWKLSLMKSPARSVMVLSMFHGIFDGGSLKLLLNDVFAAYSGKESPQRSSLNHLVKHHYQADNTSASRFWNHHLQGYTPVLFPSITPDRTPSQKSSGCVEVTSNLSHGTLKILSKSIGSTPLSVLQAAWGAILLSYTGTPDQDVVMGSVVSGRLDQDSRDCIGPTFTITPLRVSLQQLKKNSAILTNKDIARYLSFSNAKALSHLQPQLGSITVDGQLPYDTVLAYQDFGLDAEYSQLWSSIEHPAMANGFSVMVEVTPEADSSLTLRATFDTKLDSAAAELMLRQMDDLVDYILRHPEDNYEDAPLQAHLDLKSTANPTALTAPEVSEGALLHSQFEEHAASQPNDPALIFKQDLDYEGHEGNISWTYGQLNAMADDLAEHLLQTCGSLTDASVPICIEKTPALYVAILGILKAGGAWCPIDTLSPAQRRHDLIARTSAGVLLVSDLDGTQPQTAIPANVKVIDVSNFTRTVPTDQDRQPTTYRATPANMAYLIWTSGTTGAPKGVPITHSAGVSSMKSLQSDIPGNADGSPVRCLQFSQYTFDVSIQDLFYTWGIGGVLISGTREIMLESFSKLANLTQATHAHLTPAFASGVPRESCKTLKVITMIGEKLTQSVADDWGTDMKAYNTYGPAEVTVVSTIREFGNEHKSVKSANIGWPMKSVSVFVMKNHCIVMKNAIGELALGGPQLSPGYLNQKDVTDAKYIWNEEAGQRLYYTGDLVRMLSDGSLEYLTRVDDLVKLGGIRIELSEISFAMRGCSPHVESIETLILSRADRPTQVVVAFLCAPKMVGDSHDGVLVLSHEGRDVARAATNQARNVLPVNMIPSVYLVVTKIPKTPSAKVDRRALQAAYASVDLETWENDVNPEDPVSDTEDELTALVTAQVIDFVAALVSVDPSAITKSNRLRSLGVDSLRATRLAFRLKEAGHSLSVIDVLACVTVQDLIKLVRSSEPTDTNDSSSFDVPVFDKTWHAAVAEKITEEFTTVRATAIQESLLTETMGSYKMYWSNHFFKLGRSVDATRLKQAWFAVCQKNEALRTAFAPVAEIQRPAPSGKLGFSILQLIYKLPAVDWEIQKCTQDDWTAVLDDRIEDIMTRHQKDYFRNPPWAVTILDKGHERIMVFTLHHSIHDEPSLRFIFDDVRCAYAYKPPLRSQLSQALSVVLPNEQKYANAVHFWKSELKSFAGLDVPVWPDLTGKRIPPGVTPEYRLISEEVPMTASVKRLQSTAAEMGLQSIVSIVRAAWAYVSLSYLGLPATVFAETLSDRVLDSSLESTVGPFISVVPIPFRPDGTVRSILKEQHRVSVQSWKHRHVHARDIRKALQRPRGEPLYPAVFNFHAVDEKTENRSLPDHWEELEDQVGLHVEHPMAMNVFQNTDGTLTLEASSDSRIFSREHLRLFVRQIDSLITAVLTSLDEPFSNVVSRLPSDLRSISDREVSPEVANSIYQAPTYWLEKYADSNPDWTAVEVASRISTDGIVKEAMSYATLNGEANQVTAYLASFGYKNRVIGVSCGRTLASYPIIIGIFKSGNTYLPIDENLPNDRKAFLLEDSDSPIVFTETEFAPSFSGAPDSCRVECIDDPELQKLFSQMPSQNQDYKSHPDDNSYLLFTSGSTGKPKGVMVTRANLSSFIESISEFACQIAPDTLKLGGTGRYLAQANRAFDPHLLEMFFPWRHGMATVTAPRPMILDDIGTTLSKWDITHASFVPSLVDQSNITPEQCPMLRFMTVGGEKITQKVLDTWASAPNVAIVNAYGPTEVTIGCTFAHINSSTNLRNIGPPLTACKAHVLIPDTMNYALRGQTGELCFSGDLVGKGYLNRPDATGFLTGPDGVKMYRTGDIGRLMAEDSVEYLGRGDDQTKIRGQRLELGEVSEVLRASSPVPIDVVTTVAKHPGLAKVQLLSFVSRSQRGRGNDVSFLYSDFSTLGRELQEICRRKLPAFMVPELILPITSIPVAPMSGKANMKGLHQLFSELPLQTVLQGNNANGADPASQRPLTADEKVVVTEICHVISVDPGSFGPLTNIFEIGLDSLSAIGLSIRLRNAGYAATVALVMSNPVIEQLARLPRSSGAPESNSSSFQQRCKDLEAQYCSAFSKTMESSHVQAVRPCLPLQEGLLARSLNSDSDQLYVNHVTLQLGDDVDAEKLKAAWQVVANENDILRTAFASLEKEIAQVILRTGSGALQWTESEYGSLEKAIQQRKSEQAQISRAIIADISTVPPVGFQLARSSQDKRPLALFIAIHHALYDGESFAMMLEDVAARYEGEQPIQRGSPSAFLEHACVQETDKAKQHWTQTLSGSSLTVIRSNSATANETLSVTRRFNVKLSELENRSAALQTTVPNLMQAMFALLLADYVGVSDVTYGLVLSGRTISAPGADTVLLPCITTIPGRLNTNGLSTVVDVVNTVQRSTVSSLDFQHTPLRKIQQWLKSETPLFDCLFSFIRGTGPATHTLWKELDSHMPSEYPLAFEVQSDSAKDAMNLECIFSSDFGSRQDTEEFLEKMDAVLSDLVLGGSLPLANFNLAQSKASGARVSSENWDNSTWSATETKVRELTSTFCGLEVTQVSKGASFFSLGIDSVTAIQFARKLRDQGLKASSSDIMRFSCVGALARHIDESSSTPLVNGDGVHDHKKGRIPIEKYAKYVPLLSEQDSVTSMFECTPLQSGMITHTLSSGGKVYVNPHPMRLNDSVDIERLKLALRQVIQMNEILRTSFHLVPDLRDTWVGAVHANFPFEWKELTLTPTVNVLTEAMGLFAFDQETSFQVPPIRCVLVDQPDCKVLVIILHHCLYDGASLPFVFEDLATIYAGKSPVSRPQFSEVVPYVLSDQEKPCDYWTSKLQDYQPNEIPQLSSPSTNRMLATEHRINLDLAKITAACKEMEVTIHSISFLAYAKVYAQLLGTRDVAFGQVLAGRTLPHPEADRTLGPLFNTVIQRVTLDPKFLSNRALTQRLQQQTTEAQQFQHAPLQTIQKTLRQTGQLGSAQLFDALFVFQKSAALSGGALGEQDIWTTYEAEDYVVDTEYKLNVEVDHRHDGIFLTATCNGLYMNQQMLDKFVRDFEEVFSDIIEHPTRCATTLPQGLGELPLRRASQQSQTSLADDSEAPEHEELLRVILADVAGIPLEMIKPHTSIFTLGLDSLSAIRLASTCRGKGLKVSVGDTLQGNTLRGISRRVKSTTTSSVPSEEPLIKEFSRVQQEALGKLNLKSEEVEAILPCLPGQTHHLASWLKSGWKLFEPAWAFSSSTRIDGVKLRNAWLNLRNRHPVLRTVFATTSSSEPVQVVLKSAANNSETFKIIESSGSIADLAKAQAREEALRPSSLTKPPVRLRLLKATDKDGMLIMIHHSLYDAWTMPMLVSELGNLYQGEQPTTNPDFPSFIDHSIRSLGQLDEKAYWTKELMSSKSTIYKGSGASSNPEQLFVSAWEKVKNLSAMESACRRAGLSLQTIVLLAVSRCLAKATGVASPVMGLYQTGRSASFNDIENLSGPCLNVNPFIVSGAAESDSILDQAKAIQNALAERVSYEQSSLRDILNWVNPGNPSPLFNTWVNLLWMQSSIPSSADQDTKKQSHGDGDIFAPLPIGVPTDFIPSDPLPPQQTPIDDLDTSYLPNQNIFLDIGPDPKTDTICFGVRVEGGFMTEQEVRDMIDGVAVEIEGDISGL